MAGKDDGTRQTAPGGASETTEIAGAVPMPETQPEPATAVPKLHVVRDEDNLDGQANMQTEPPPERGPRKTAGMLDRSLQQRIGAILRDSFTDIEREPLPERLTKLMEALRAQERRQ
jgi:hypothetical protein